MCPPQVGGSTPTCWGFWGECRGPCWWPGPASSTPTPWRPRWSTSSSWSFPNGENQAATGCTFALHHLMALFRCWILTVTFKTLWSSHREWPNPVLLKQPEDSNLNLPVWDPRVSTTPQLTMVAAAKPVFLTFPDSLDFRSTHLTGTT